MELQYEIVQNDGKVTTKSVQYEHENEFINEYTFGKMVTPIKYYEKAFSKILKLDISLVEGNVLRSLDILNKRDVFIINYPGVVFRIYINTKELYKIFQVLDLDVLAELIKDQSQSKKYNKKYDHLKGKTTKELYSILPYEDFIKRFGVPGNYYEEREEFIEDGIEITYVYKKIYSDSKVLADKNPELYFKYRKTKV